MDWKSDHGAVTAELMALIPTVLLGLTALGWLLSLMGQQLALEQDLSSLLRLHLIGHELDVADGLKLEQFTRGRLSCIVLQRSGLITLRGEQCGIPIA
ncbi:MAG: hypothetical protein RIS08_120 [Actinomycetota bacterium]